MIKIVHLTSVHPAFENRILYKECVSLSQASYQVVLIVPHDRDEVVDGVMIHALPKPSGRKERLFSISKQIYRAAIKEDGQIYHIHDPELLPVGQMLRRKGKRVVFDMHENVPLSLLSKPWIKPSVRGITKAVYSAAERFLLHGMPVIFAEDSYQKYYQWIKQQITVLNMPILDSLFSLTESHYSNFTVGYMGRVAVSRGSVVTLEALRILANRGKFVEFECVGPASEQEQLQLEKMIETCKLDGIQFYGRQLPDAGWRIMARCHVGLAVLQDIPNYVESYPTKIFEYMALGLPVIASNFPLYRNIVEKNKCGICVNPAKPIEVADAIQWLQEHPAEARKMGERGREAVRQQFNWDMEARKLVTFYRNILAE